MSKGIHLKTIQAFYKEKFDIEIEAKSFDNSKTGETYDAIFEKGLDVAFITKISEGRYLCLDSDGEKIDGEKIFGVVNAPISTHQDGTFVFNPQDLQVHYQYEIMSNEELLKREDELFPERTKIMFRGMFSCNGYTNGVTNFYVDEIIYANEKQFEEIRMGEESELLKQYNEKTYEPIYDGLHGVVVVGPDGDGIMIDTQGHDYARYMSYAPQIKSPLEYMINQSMRENAVHEIKLFAPMTVTECDEEQNEERIDGREHFNAIQEAFEKANALDNERGLANYLHNEKLKAKIYSIKPELTVENDALMAVVAIRLTKPLEHYELEELTDFCAGQLCDGWGESSYFDGIRTDGTYLFVHFMDEQGDEVMTEEEVMQMSEQQDMGMQGMSGMQM